VYDQSVGVSDYAGSSLRRRLHHHVCNDCNPTARLNLFSSVKVTVGIQPYHILSCKLHADARIPAPSRSHASIDNVYTVLPGCEGIPLATAGELAEELGNETRAREISHDSLLPRGDLFVCIEKTMQ
jgi:hypothetical protein